MSKGPKKDPTSLGSILLEWNVITEADLERALNDQETLRGDDLLGRLLVANGACSKEEVDAAISAQEKLRKSGKFACAMAVADFALGRRRRKSVVTRAVRVADQGERLRRVITGDSHPVVAPAMLAKPGDS